MAVAVKDAPAAHDVGKRKSRTPPNVRVAVAFLIALASIIGAGGGWKAAQASIHADEWDRAGFHDQIEAVRLQAAVLQERQANVATYVRWLAYHNLGRNAAADLAWHQLKDSNAAGAKQGEVNFDRAYAIDLHTEAQSEGISLEPRIDFANANRERRKAERLVFLSALMIVAAIAFALAQVMRRYRIWIALGGVVLLAAFAAAVYVELAT